MLYGIGLLVIVSIASIGIVMTAIVAPSKVNMILESVPAKAIMIVAVMIMTVTLLMGILQYIWRPGTKRVLLFGMWAVTYLGGMIIAIPSGLQTLAVSKEGVYIAFEAAGADVVIVLVQ